VALLPPLPALHASHAGLWIGTPDGDVRAVSRGEAVSFAAETPMVLLNAPLTGQRLGYDALSGLDLLELWAFVHPARFLVPTLKGLAQALGLEPPAHEQDTPAMLIAAAAALATQIAHPPAGMG
jgi:ATP-dependent DNA helicase DinG